MQPLALSPLLPQSQASRPDRTGAARKTEELLSDRAQLLRTQRRHLA